MPSSSKNPFESELQATWKYPDTLRHASEDVTTAVTLAWAAARSVFGKQAKPQHAIDLARLFLERAASPGAVTPAPAHRPDEPPAGGSVPELALQAPPARKGRKTALEEEPPRAPSKIGRPARL